MRPSDYVDAGALDARVRLHKECSTNPYGWQRWVMDQVFPHLRGSVLEVGTGPAYLWVENANRIPADIHLVLSDRSEGMLRDAKARMLHIDGDHDWLLCDVTRLPVAAASVDTVIANHMLFLLEDPAQAVRQLARSLRPGGILCATTNARNNLQGLIEVFIELSEEHFGHLGRGEFMLRRERFNFISGAEHLLDHFDDIQLVTYEDGLAIDRAEVLRPYLDHWAQPALDPEQYQCFLNDISSRIAQEGVLRIAKNSGMFIARKGE